MKIKSILGFCSCKGCRKKYDFDIELKAGGKRKNLSCVRSILKNS